MNQEENNNTSSTLGNLASSVPSSTDNSKTKFMFRRHLFLDSSRCAKVRKRQKRTKATREWKARKKKAAAS